MRNVILRAGAGSYAASFTSIEPPPRYAPAGDQAGPWTHVRASEGATRVGPWTTLGVVELLPLDTDPAEPEPVRLTIAGAGLVAGWYVIELLDQAGNSQPFAPLYNGQSWRPSVKDVADVSPAYTNSDGDFDEGTYPTATDVDGYISVAVQEIAGRVGMAENTLSRLADLARTAALWHAAASVEGQKAPEGDSTGMRWKQGNYTACLADLTEQARRAALRLT